MDEQRTNLYLQIDDSIDDTIHAAQFEMEKVHGKDFASVHELYAILKEELDEFWDSIKQHNPDPKELLDLIVAARSGLLWMCAQSRNEMQDMNRGDRR